jgi:hypothetical protein
VGTLGTICFEVFSPHAGEDAMNVVELDNVRLVPLSGASNNPAVATSELRGRQ